MKAYVYRRYGPPDVLELTELAKPTPGEQDVLIQVHATTVNSADWRLRSLTLPRGFGLIAPLAVGIGGPRKPVLGTEVAGVVEAVGGSVTQFKAGDEVFAFPGANLGGHAQYICMPANGRVALKPPNLSFEQAAALCFGGTTMLDFYARAKLREGERVLINGASGTVGSAAVQLAKHVGAHVTGVCSTVNADFVRSLGADAVIDYTQSDFATTGELYDVVVDTVGNAPFARSAPALAKGGRLLLVLADLPGLLSAPWHSLTSGKKVIAGPVVERTEYVTQLAELAASGRFTPVVDRRYTFEQMVDAHRYVDGGHKRGSVVVTLVH